MLNWRSASQSHDQQWGHHVCCFTSLPCQAWNVSIREIWICTWLLLKVMSKISCRWAGSIISIVGCVEENMLVFKILYSYQKETQQTETRLWLISWENLNASQSKKNLNSSFLILLENLQWTKQSRRWCWYQKYSGFLHSTMLNGNVCFKHVSYGWNIGKWRNMSNYRFIETKI